MPQTAGMVASPTDGAPIVRTEPVDIDSGSNFNKDCTMPTTANAQAAVYDCILDQGLMEAVLALNNEEALHDLTMEAATAIREHGIYVLVTTHPLTTQQKDWLVDIGVEAGLEWEMDLDGISDPNVNQVVSVARRFNTGAMPKVGRLSRYQI